MEPIIDKVIDPVIEKITETTFVRKDNNTLIVHEVEPERLIPANFLPAKEYDYAFLLKQRDDIQTQWDEQLAQKDKEIANINEQRSKEKAFVEQLIMEAGKLGIVEKELPIEPSKEVILPIEEIIK